MTVYYLDDLHVEQRFTSGSQVLDEAQIKRFASEFARSRFISMRWPPRRQCSAAWQLGKV